EVEHPARRVRHVPEATQRGRGDVGRDDDGAGTDGPERTGPRPAARRRGRAVRVPGRVRARAAHRRPGLRRLLRRAPARRRGAARRPRHPGRARAGRPHPVRSRRPGRL
ncbi:MAG: hypothetical protein AVDCRST_MAG66-2670, partial [uncultured Pseudonocardia sp.]